MQSIPILSAKSKPSLKIIVKTPNLHQCISDSNLKSPISVLSPVSLSNHLDTSSHFRPLLSSKSPMPSITFQEYKNKVKQKLNKLEEKWKANNIFSKELNTLRKKTLKKISLHKKKTSYKKNHFHSARNIIQGYLPPLYKSDEPKRCWNKHKLLEELEREIMHSPNNPSINQPEQKEQQSISDFLAFVNKLNGDEKKKYTPNQVEVIKLGPRKVMK